MEYKKVRQCLTFFIYTIINIKEERTKMNVSVLNFTSLNLLSIEIKTKPTKVKPIPFNIVEKTVAKMPVLNANCKTQLMIKI